LGAQTLGLEPPKPEPSTPAAAAPGAPAPPEPASADELDDIKKAVDDAASVGAGLWLSYLFVLFYLAVAAGAVTHADLFLENPVKLPFLKAFAKVLKDVICSGDDQSVYILRGLLGGANTDRIGARLPSSRAALIGFMSKDCPVAAALTDDDRANLLQIKQAIEADSKPATGPAP
jgi:hypothetical protein